MMNLSAEQKSFLGDLKSQTSESHKMLEANAASVAILDDQVSTGEYQNYLLALYPFVKATEKYLFPKLNHVFDDLEKRAKSELIYNDLLATGLSEDQIASLDIIDFGSTELPDALGIMYVMEGSTLGGRILYKHIHEKLGYDQASGASYFAGYGAHTGSMWASFISIFSDVAVSEMKESQIIEAANNTFKRMDEGMTVANFAEYDKN